ncbi:trypsin-like serine proteases [Candidatus Scalindua japonica]|uniref:Trypsin-like serine proteases n=1 Tax=Candidatus Scalindua japonica TaxID=1284222 RepID=A0A286TY35_9BACT|nr:trypsin-like peptidase domain-containing protein [Candidatus Scalindua japonica]GAX60803.1 trypsin-like serine proteases [Candidatus Scalindua japonica]
MKKGYKPFIWFVAVKILLLISLLPATINAKETFPRRNAIVAAVEKVGSSVANLSTERLLVDRRADPFFGYRNDFFDQYFNDFFGHHAEKRVEQPLGSGVIIDEDGYIITNEHVINRATVIKVTLADGSKFDATLISSDFHEDLAILKIESPTPLDYIKMGTSSDLMIGETVIALGNPFGLENSVTTGVLSAKNRTFSIRGEDGAGAFKGLIQTDALINPGNSGGPLVNINGDLIGINTAIVNQAQGIGFAIPVDEVKDILSELFSFREIKKIWLGIEVEETGEGKIGVLVTKVEEESPAENAGIQVGDVLVEMDSITINEVFDFNKNMLKKDIDHIVTFRISRNESKKNLKVKLQKIPLPSVEQLASDKFGLDVQELKSSIAESLRLGWLKGGVLISGVESNSPAERAGIEPGFVLVRIGQYRIFNLEELGMLLNQIKRGDFVSIGFVFSDSSDEYQKYTRLRSR